MMPDPESPPAFTTMRRLLVLLLLPLCVAGCPGGDDGDSPKKSPWLKPASVIGPSGGSANPDGGAPAALTITGQVTFDRLPVTATGLGSTPTVEDAAGVLVEAVRHNDIHDVVASTSTDAAGNYTLNLNLSHDFFIRARAQSGTGPDIDQVYHARTNPALVHAVTGPILQRAAGNQTANLHASHALPDNRAGAFAILDTVQRLRQSVTASFPSLGALDVFWCTGATAATGTDEVGPNGRPTIHLRGGTLASPETTDHDEYDETVIAHEWASFVQLTQSRDNNFGGPHAGEELLFTAAYSEGVVTAIGCGLLGTSLYRDTVGYPGGITSVQFEFDCESGLLFGQGDGYSNEFRVTRIVWDLLDGGAGWPADTDTDGAAVDAADFFASFAALATRVAPYEVAWLASLLQQLVDDTHLTVMQADTLMQSQSANFPPAGAFDAFPELLVIGVTDSGSLDAHSGVNPNPILGPQANAVYRLELAAAQPVTFTLSNTTAGYAAANHRLDLSVVDLDRNFVASVTGNSANKSTTVSLAAGTYIVRVQHLPASAASSQPSSFNLVAN